MVFSIHGLTAPCWPMQCLPIKTAAKWNFLAFSKQSTWISIGPSSGCSDSWVLIVKGDMCSEFGNRIDANDNWIGY